MAKPSKETLKALRASLNPTSIRPSKVEEVVEWVKERNASIFASLKPTSIKECQPWFYDESDSTIHNEARSFFSIQGLKYSSKNIKVSQPIILQNEVGYLGFIYRSNDGILEFLIQAKIEPGNVNKVQLSPTIQATKSNFTQKHGGRKPSYLEYFVDVDRYEVLCDYEEPEQCARFFSKYNRNVAIVVDDPVETSENFRWLTLAEIKQIMNTYDNLVNMDTRTIISCLPYRDCFLVEKTESEYSKSFSGIDSSEDIISGLIEKRNESNIVRNLCRLDELTDWNMTDTGMTNPLSPFSVGYFDIHIEGREKTEWRQPLFVAEGSATFGTFIRKNSINGILEVLIRMKEEVGAKDAFIFAPLIQKEATEEEELTSEIEAYFYECLSEKRNIITDVVLSEEGGRFYQEQNRNVIIMLDKDIEVPKDSFWVNFATMSSLIRRDDPVVNIQMRNLFALLGEGNV